MNQSELHDKLITAARAIPADDRVPHAFEKRIMALLAGKAVEDPWELWGRALSRAAVCCVIFMLMLAAGAWFLPANNPDTLSQEVQKTLFAAVDNSADQAGDIR
jgi:hypothetical protein